jgi:ubiquinone/menaquinone biosynthesis C-methylase UbiE
MQESTTAFSGSIPDMYDRYLGPLLFEPYAQDLADLIKPGAGVNLLELACGTGRVTRLLADGLPSSSTLVASDLNPDMLLIAKQKIPGAKVDWLVADAQELPFEEASFDILFCQFGFMFVPDKARAFAEAYRVLKPGGRFLFSVWDKIENNPVFFYVHALMTSFFPENPPQFYQVPFSFHDPERLKFLLDSSGFRDAQIDLVKKKSHSPSSREAATGIVKGSPIFAFITERDPSLIDPICEKVEKEIGSRFGDKPMQAPMQAWVCQAWK